MKIFDGIQCAHKYYTDIHSWDGIKKCSMLYKTAMEAEMIQRRDQVIIENLDKRLCHKKKTV